VRVDAIRLADATLVTTPAAERLRSTDQAVVERLVADAVTSELALEVFVTVDAELAVVREVRAELDEERTKVSVDTMMRFSRRRRTQDRN
jgi:hypothetical protein